MSKPKSKAKPGPPKCPTDFSSNWKKLQATLQVNEKKRKREDPPHDTKRDAKRRKEDDKQKSDKVKQFKQTRPAGGLHKGQASDKTNVSNGKLKETTKPEEKNEIWFDDVDEILLERPPSSSGNSKESLLFKDAVTHVTKAVAMDCEMVGVGAEGAESVLARVSIVNQHGHCVYDKYVKPREKVTDFRTRFSGIRPHNLRDAEDFLVVQKEVSDLLKGKILVGHALHNDLKVLFLDHPRKDLRDTAMYKPFRQLSGGRTPALKKLTHRLLGVSVQQGEHNSIQDAQAAMRLYTMHRKRWEKELDAHRRGKKNKVPGKKKKKTDSKQVHVDSSV